MISSLKVVSYFMAFVNVLPLRRIVRFVARKPFKWLNFQHAIRAVKIANNACKSIYVYY